MKKWEHMTIKINGKGPIKILRHLGKRKLNTYINLAGQGGVTLQTKSLAAAASRAVKIWIKDCA